VHISARRIGATALGLVCAAALASPASAGTTSSNLGVSATVTANCTVSTSALAFGSFDALAGAAVTGTGGVTVTCTNGTVWTAAADAGTGSGATMAVRKLTYSGNTLNYSIYTTNGYGTVWGDGTSSTATVGATGNGTAQSVTVYGRITAGQTGAPAGGYSDTVAVTITY
jgi:spore coat protein U-like protein